jgi:hypothetical protein
MKKNVSRPDVDLFDFSDPLPAAAPILENRSALGDRAIGVEVRAQRMREAVSELSTASTRFGMGKAYNISRYADDIERRYRPDSAAVVDAAVANGENALGRARSAFYGAYFGTWAMTEEVQRAITPDAQDAWEDFCNMYSGAAGADARAQLDRTLANQVAGYQATHLIPEYIK